MSRAQKRNNGRNNKAIQDLRENAAQFVRLHRHQLSGDITAFERDLFDYLTTSYYAGTANGAADEQDHHKAIGGCPR